MMIGGDKAAVDRLDPILGALAPGAGNIERTDHRDGRDPRVENGYMHCGPAGAGHFVKMVHNGIEYGIMQAYAEGMDVIKHKDSEELPENERFTIDIADVAEVWRRGSVISSWLLDLTSSAWRRTRRWRTSRATSPTPARDAGRSRPPSRKPCPPTCSRRRCMRASRSRGNALFANKLLSAMRFAFGGHVEPKA